MDKSFHSSVTTKDRNDDSENGSIIIDVDLWRVKGNVQYPKVSIEYWVINFLSVLWSIVLQDIDFTEFEGTDGSQLGIEARENKVYMNFQHYLP